MRLGFAASWACGRGVGREGEDGDNGGKPSTRDVSGRVGRSDCDEKKGFRAGPPIENRSKLVNRLDSGDFGSTASSINFGEPLKARVTTLHTIEGASYIFSVQ